MDWATELWRRVRYLFQRAQSEQDLAEEMRLHMELRAAEQATGGTNPHEAEAQARRRFGNVSQLREKSREVWGWTLLDTLAQDVRYGLRTLAADPGFAATAVLSLALGIGANTAIFGILNAVMLRSLPVEDPHQLMELRSGDNGYFTNPLWEEIRDHQKAFSGMVAYSSDRFDLSGGGESRFAQGMWVSGDFFRVLGVPAMRGRVFTPDDDLHGGGHSGAIAVISYAFWKGNFGGDPNVIGKTVKLNRHTFQVAGVTPPWFTGLDVDRGYDVAIPIGCEPLLHTDRSALDQRSWWWLRLVGRLLPAETLQQAEARMNSIAPEIARATVPTDWDPAGQKRFLQRSYKLRPAATGFSNTAAQYKKALFTLMTVVG
jgi:putative ABC transport system permease protein